MDREIEKYIEYVVYKKYNFYTRLGIQKEDLIQIGRLAYYELLEEHGTSVPINKVLNKISYEIKKYIVKVDKESNIVQFDDEADYTIGVSSLDTEVGTLYTMDPVDIIEEQEIIESILDYRNKLNDREAHIIWSMFLADTPKSAVEIGRELGISKQRVKQLVSRIMERLQ